MATKKQQVALAKAVENGGNVTAAMRDAGYSEATINNPSNLTKSKGFQEMCDDNGLTDDFLVKALMDDIKSNKGDRIAELALAFKIKGRFADAKAKKNKYGFDPDTPRIVGMQIIFDDSFNKAKQQAKEAQVE